jgi:uncharacterized protein YndB with AHSA1/START domain
MEQITVKSIIKAPISRVWECWTLPKHIIKWNFASNDWHCPKAENNLIIGGEFHYLMEAKDGSFNFDFWGTYVTINEGKYLEILLGDGRRMSVSFELLENETIITERFDPETQNSVELQKTGWQMILDNFKLYVENSLFN